MRNESALEAPPEPVSVTVDGRTFTGSWRSGRGFVMLKSDLGDGIQQRGRLPAAKVAEIMLRKLAVAAHPPQEPASP